LVQGVLGNFNRIEGRAAYSIFKAVALTGRIAHCLYTQGVALGYELLPFQGVLLWVAWRSGRAAAMSF
jgi:hypothetical protein